MDHSTSQRSDALDSILEVEMNSGLSPKLPTLTDHKQSTDTTVTIQPPHLDPNFESELFCLTEPSKTLSLNNYLSGDSAKHLTPRSDRNDLRLIDLSISNVSSFNESTIYTPTHRSLRRNSQTPPSKKNRLSQSSKFCKREVQTRLANYVILLLPLIMGLLLFLFHKHLLAYRFVCYLSLFCLVLITPVAVIMPAPELGGLWRTLFFKRYTYLQCLSHLLNVYSDLGALVEFYNVRSDYFLISLLSVICYRVCSVYWVWIKYHSTWKCIAQFFEVFALTEMYRCAIKKKVILSVERLRNLEVIVEDIVQVFLNFSFINHQLSKSEAIPTIIWFSLSLSAWSIASCMSKFDRLNLKHRKFMSVQMLIRRCFRISEGIGNIVIAGLFHLATEDRYGVFICLFSLFFTVFLMQLRFSTLPFSNIFIKSCLWLVKIPSFSSKTIGWHYNAQVRKKLQDDNKFEEANRFNRKCVRRLNQAGWPREGSYIEIMKPYYENYETIHSDINIDDKLPFSSQKWFWDIPLFKMQLMIRLVWNILFGIAIHFSLNYDKVQKNLADPLWYVGIICTVLMVVFGLLMHKEIRDPDQGIYVEEKKLEFQIQIQQVSEQMTIYFDTLHGPEDIGITPYPGVNKVKHVREGSQAERHGVKPGWRFNHLDENSTSRLDPHVTADDLSDDSCITPITPQDIVINDIPPLSLKVPDRMNSFSFLKRQQSNLLPLVFDWGGIEIYDEPDFGAYTGNSISNTELPRQQEFGSTTKVKCVAMTEVKYPEPLADGSQKVLFYQLASDQPEIDNMEGWFHNLDETTLKTWTENPAYMSLTDIIMDEMLSVDVVSTLVENYVIQDNDLYAADSKGESILTKAARLGKVEIIRTLLDAGIDVNRPDAKDQTPLCVAILWKQTDVMKLLLKPANDCLFESTRHKVDVNKPGSGGDQVSAIHVAAIHVDLDTLIYLLEHNASVNQLSVFGNAAHIMFDSNRPSKERSTFLRNLIYHRIDVNMATCVTELDVTSPVCSLGSDTVHGNILGFDAADNEEDPLQMMRRLTIEGVPIPRQRSITKTAFGAHPQTLLSRLCGEEFEQGMADSMIENLTEDRSITKKQLLYIEKDIKMLLKAKADPTTGLWNAFDLCNLDRLKLLVEHNADVNFQGDDGYTMLNQCCFFNEEMIPNVVEIAEFLIESRADLNIRNDEGFDCYDTSERTDIGDGCTDEVKKMLQKIPRPARSPSSSSYKGTAI